MATFGKTTSGTSTWSYTAGTKIVSAATLAENADLTSLTVRVRASNTTEAKHFKGVIYSDNAGSPDVLMAVTEEITFSNTAVASLTANFSGVSLPAGNYWVGLIYDSNSTTSVFLYRDNVGSSAARGNNTYSAGAPNPYSTFGLVSGPIDAYVTYSPASTTTTTTTTAATTTTTTTAATTTTTTTAATTTTTTTTAATTTTTTTAAPTGHIKAYDGSGFVAKPMKVWDGTAWVQKPVKRWDGTAWVLTNY